jgi:DMSO/TMAO reductase YedYZ molybdopterin-dependent catalytic subunit
VGEAGDRPNLSASFWRGFRTGFIVLVVWFIIRLGGLAPFPPESALVSFFSIIPASLEEPAVQGLGELAGLVGLLVAMVAGAAVYGVLALVFDRYMLPRVPSRGPSRLEWTLVYAVVPWLVFGAVLLPLTGESFFGTGSNIASPSVSTVFPFTILLVQLLWGLLLWGRSRPPLFSPSRSGAAPPAGPGPSVPARRTFIERSLIYAGVAVVLLASLGSAVGALFSEGSLVAEGSDVILAGTPINAASAPAIFGDPRLAALVNSEVTNNDSFYRVAIDIFDPNVSGSEWSLALTGLVATPKSYSLSDMLKLPRADEYSTFICVSNLVNGGLISNAHWGGVKLSDLFADAGGVSPNASYVVFHSVDGYTVGIPIAKAMEQESILAYEMNGFPLPQRHGFPLRAVIPGLYGMMSAKWVREVELSDSVYLGYWQTRGWSNDATVQTASFIRIPQDGASVSLGQNGGTVMIGGVAFSGDRGISKVEVSVDGGKTWEQATLKPPASKLSWVLWAYEWTPQGTGQYPIYARATDGKDQVQTSDISYSFPSGATGYVMTTVNVVS